MDQAEQGAATSDDWARHATAWVERVVEAIRHRSVRPVLLVVQILVVGILVALVGIFVAVASAIGIVRLLTADAFGGRVWASDLVVGGIFAAAGTFLLARSRARRSDDHAE